MKWFLGSIAEAITFAQGQKATFVAYIEGQCEKSQLMTSIFNDREVCSSLECSRFVVVKLEANSVGYRQLVEIYKKVPIPSLFYISYTGVPLDIVDGSLFDDVTELKEAILDATIKCNQLNSNQSPPRTGISHDKLLEERRSQIDQILENRRRSKESSRKSVPKENNESSEEKKENIDVKQQKMAQQNAELLKLAEEREKERREEAQARQRILEQIAQDKAERAQRMRPVETQPKNEVKTPPPSNGNMSHSSQARIQFRLPTGESKSNMFKNDTKLSQIRDYIDSNFELPYRDYRLATTFPRREFTNDDNESSLEQLNLIPTAVLLILSNSSSRVSPYSRSFMTLVTDLVQSFFHPIYSLTNYLRGLISRQADRPPNSQESSSQPSSNQGQPRNYVRRVGNIHSLRDIRDGNDENNTWNGNSTQQM